jgi:8-oxo-dGTP pyrophosphatase MutT (NUDIX family)
MARQERSAGFVIFFQPPAGPAGPAPLEFLLLNYGRHWDFPKGHVEQGEDDLTAALRELREETGIADARVVPGFQREMTYYFRHKRYGLIHKTVVFFLAETPSRDVTLSHEHTGFEFLPFEQAVKRLTFPTARQMLRAAWERLNAP